MLTILLQTRTALLSLFIFVLGNSLLASFLPLQMHAHNASTIMIGLMTTAYYGGLAIGSFNTEGLLLRLGHIRVFASFASLLAVVCMLHGFNSNQWFWFFLRLVAGFCTGTLYVVVESWLLAKSDITIRGTVLSFYMISLYGAQAAGQFLLNLSPVQSIIPFCIASILASLAVVPLAMTRAVAPELAEPAVLNLRSLYNISPTGVVGSLIAGLILGGMYGLLPLMFTQLNLPVSKIAQMMAVVILGGMLLQLPVGRLSDLIDRRRMLFIMSVVNAVLCVGLLFVMPSQHYTAQIILLFLLGGASFTLYPLSINHTCDRLSNDQMVAGSQGLLIIYSAGATVGPLIAAIFMRDWLGHTGLLFYFLLLSGVIAWVALWRQHVQPAVAGDESAEYVTVTTTSPIAAEFDLRNDEAIADEPKETNG